MCWKYPMKCNDTHSSVWSASGYAFDIEFTVFLKWVNGIKLSIFYEQYWVVFMGIKQVQCSLYYLNLSNFPIALLYLLTVARSRPLDYSYSMHTSSCKENGVILNYGVPCIKSLSPLQSYFWCPDTYSIRA